MDVDVVDLKGGRTGVGVELNPHERVRCGGLDASGHLAPVGAVAQPCEADGPAVVVGTPTSQTMNVPRAPVAGYWVRTHAVAQ